MDVAPNLPKPSQWVLRRSETPVSVDAAPTSFLGLTAGPVKAGGLLSTWTHPHFPEVYTGGPEEVSVWLCGCGPTSSQNVTTCSEEAGGPVTVDAAPRFQKPQFLSEGPGSSCQSGGGTTSS